MKKITTLFGAMILSCFFFQANAQARDISTILSEYQALKNTSSPEMEIIDLNFNEADKIVLLNYFAEVRAEREAFTPLQRIQIPSEFNVLNIRGGVNYGTLNGEAPFSEITTIVNPFGPSCFADDFATNGTYYGLQSLNDADGNPMTRAIIDINSEDGTFETLADIGPDTNNANPTGLAYDFTTDIMYLTSNGILFTVDLTDGVLTSVGELLMDTPIWLVIDNEGNAYAGDIMTDLLYSVNLQTGLGTPIGPFNVDLSFAQDASIDPEDNTLYMAAYEGGGVGGIYTVDVTTGEATLVGDTTPLNAEFGMFSISGNPFLSVDDKDASNFSVFPNPSNGNSVTIKTQTIGAINVVVFDVLGKKVINTVVDNNSLNVSSLNTGVYIIQVTQNGNTAQQKLIVN